MRKWLKWIDQCCCEVCNLFPQKIYFEHFTLNKEVHIETPTQKPSPLFCRASTAAKKPLILRCDDFKCYLILYSLNVQIVQLCACTIDSGAIPSYSFIHLYFILLHLQIISYIYIYSHHTVTDTETSHMWREMFVAFFVVKSSIVFLQVTCAKCDAEVPSVRCDGTTGLAIVLSEGWSMFFLYWCVVCMPCNMNTIWFLSVYCCCLACCMLIMYVSFFSKWQSCLTCMLFLH